MYVVIIAQLSHALAEHTNLSGIATFVFLFTIVYWAWVNGAMYHDLHGNNDIRTRVFTFLQMFTVAAMAVFAQNAMGGGSVGFALAYAAFQLILTWLWWRTGVYLPEHRALSRPYSIVLLITSLLYIVSILVPAPWRFILWGLALVIDLAAPLVIAIRTDAAGQEELRRTLLLSPSVVERFGLFTIIVLGEVIVGVVSGVAGHQHLGGLVGVTAALGMVIAIGLWWVYFDFVSGRHPIAQPFAGLGWIYFHLPVTIGIAAVGASVLNAVEHAGEPLSSDVRWLLVGAIAAALVGIALIMQILDIPASYRSLYRRGSILTLVAGVVVLVLGMTPIGTVPLLLALIALLLAPALYGLVIWIKVFGAAELEA